MKTRSAKMTDECKVYAGLGKTRLTVYWSVESLVSSRKSLVHRGHSKFVGFYEPQLVRASCEKI